MTRFTITWPILALMIGAGFFGMPPPARATFQLMLQSPAGTGTPLIVSDGGAGDAYPGPPGTPDGYVSYQGPYGSFTFNSTTGHSGAIGPTPTGVLDLSSFNMTSTTGGSITIVLAATGYASPPSPLLLVSHQVGGVLSGTGASVTFQTFVDPGDGSPISGPGPSAGTVSTAPLTFGPGAFSGSNYTFFTPSGPTYSQWIVATVTFGQGGGSISFNSLNEVIAPAPPGLVLALCGAPLVGFACWRRARQKPS